MGVPAFYKWLQQKYPKAVVDAVEERVVGEGGGVDVTQPNPNGIEFDNLYLDMNGIIHPCFHPDNHSVDSFHGDKAFLIVKQNPDSKFDTTFSNLQIGPLRVILKTKLFPPPTFDDVFNSMFEYIDRLFHVVRPRKLLYMAIDGVAPRAKMNQQRSRRFQTAKQAELEEVEEQKLREEFQLEGKDVISKMSSEVSDSNVITPGTEFMDRLSKALKKYIRLKLTTDPGWRKIKVILSDANVPGEGEHKIMSFIRQQRNREGYNPNTCHCLYGLDADLIMLALATHEIYFSVLREDTGMVVQEANCMLSLGASLSKQNAYTIKSRPSFGKLQFLNIWTLREYLELDLTISETPKDIVINFERVIDDFIFLCFFVGNDFLPRSPSLEIHEGAIDLLMTVYKQQFKSMGGYLVDTCRLKEKHAAYIKFKRVERLMLAVGSYEDKIFKKRSERWQSKIDQIMREVSEDKGEADLNDLYDQHTGENNQRISSALDNNARGDYCRMPNDVPILHCSETVVLQNTIELKRKLKDILQRKSDLFKTGNVVSDKVRYGSEGFKYRYYKTKFSVEKPDEIESKRKEIVHKYAEGLCWVLRYYFEGVCSWSWYYDHYYGPFASDFKGISGASIRFQLGTPFKPFTQLMAVLPRRSAHVLPRVYRDLMTCPESNIRDFYPDDFEVDTECKRFMWQGVTLLEFIDEKRLLLEMDKLENKLKGDEVKLNSVKHELIFVSVSQDFGSQVSPLCQQHVTGSENVTIEKVAIDNIKSGGLNGFLKTCCGCSCTDDGNLMDFNTKSVVCAAFENPTFDYHIPEPPKNITMPDKTITEADIKETQLWHEIDFKKPSFSHRSINVLDTDTVRKQNSAWPRRETFKAHGSGCVRGRGMSSQGSMYYPNYGFHGRGNGSFEKANFRPTSQYHWGFSQRGGFGQPRNVLQGRGNGSFEKHNFRQTWENHGGNPPRGGGFGQARNGFQGRGNGSFGISNSRQTTEEAFRGLEVGDNNDVWAGRANNNRARGGFSNPARGRGRSESSSRARW